MLSHRTIQSEFQLGTEGTYLNLDRTEEIIFLEQLNHLTCQLQDRDTYGAQCLP